MPLLIVDLDDTLVDREETLRRLVERRLGRPLHARWPRLARRAHLHRLVSRLAALYETADPRCYRLENGVEDALVRLRGAGWKVALATNGNRRTQPAKIASAGIEPLVDAIVISSHEGFAKPDPRVFRLAARRAGSGLDGAWVVGDDLSQEIAGARRLGLRSVWVNKSGRPGNGDVDLEARSFPEAVDLVLTRSPRPGPSTPDRGRPTPPM